MGVYCPDISGDSLWMVDTELHFAFLKESVGDLILNFFGRNQFSKSNFLFVMFAMNWLFVMCFFLAGNNLIPEFPICSLEAFDVSFTMCTSQMSVPS